MKQVGLILIAIGLCWGFFAFDMPTTVNFDEERAFYSPGKPVYNIGLMDRRRDHMMISFTFIISGVFLFGCGAIAASKLPTTTAIKSVHEEDLYQKKCPACTENIKLEALRCKHCGEIFDPSDVKKQIEEHKNNQEYELIKGKSGEAFCVLCRTISPVDGMIYNKSTDTYYHKGCFQNRG